MKINHAILHVFDFVSCVNVYAQEELDLASKNAKRYVTSHAKKALGNMDSKRGEFAEDSMFAEELRAYFRGQRGFVDLSVQVAEFIAGELGRMEKSESARPTRAASAARTPRRGCAHVPSAPPTACAHPPCSCRLSASGCPSSA